MVVNAPAAPAAQPRQAHPPRRHHRGSLLWSAARTPRGIIGLVLVSFVAGVAVIGPFVTPYSPDTNAPLALDFAKPSAQFLLGTDVHNRQNMGVLEHL